MPIRPENRLFYPIDWAQLSDVIVDGEAHADLTRSYAVGISTIQRIEKRMKAGT
jgi:hypothetical protein